MKFVIKICLFLLCSPALFGASQPTLIKEFKTETGIGKAYRDSGMSIITLSGSYYDMGNQYGNLMGPQIKASWNAIVEGLLIKPGLATMPILTELLYDGMWPGITNRQKEIYRGLANATGLSVQQHFILDEIDFAIEALALSDFFSCSFLSAWNNYTIDGKLYLGRNWDWAPQFKHFSDLLTIVVFKPTDGSQFVASIDYAGNVNVITGFNNAGLFVEINSGNSEQMIVTNREPYLNQVLDVLFDSDSPEALEYHLNTRRTGMPFIVNTASPQAGVVYENSPDLTLKRTPASEAYFNSSNTPNKIGATNNFLLKAWGIIPIEDFTHTLRRYEMLSALAEANQGKISRNVMKNIFQQPLCHLANGTFANGFTMYEKCANSTFNGKTIFSVIYCPEDNILSFRIPTTPQDNNWIDIDLGYYFKK